MPAVDAVPHDRAEMGVEIELSRPNEAGAVDAPNLVAGGGAPLTSIVGRKLRPPRNVDGPKPQK